MTRGGTKLLMLTKRRKTKTFSGYYALVGGKIDAGEDGIAAAKREMLEETNYYPQAMDLTDCFVDGEFKCFFFEINLPMYRFRDIKNLEPKKHSPWKLYTINEALKLEKLMPSLRTILLERVV